MLLFIVTPFALLIVRLARFATLEGINTPEADPPNDKVDVAIVARFVGIPAIVGPFNVSILGPTVNVPAVRVNVPLIAKSAPNIIFLLVVKLFSPPATAFKVISAPVPIVRLEVTPPAREPPP
jgi:hypothetical protein